MIPYRYRYLPVGNARYEGTVHDNADFILHKQLLDQPLWDKFVHVFTERPDSADLGWRGEYYGKMMRGACLTYRYLPSEELYTVLYDTVKALLDTRDADGRITTYPKDKEYCGWDMWTRKYVLVGSLYFYGICRDEAFKARILTAMKSHVDYLIATLGEGKLSVLDTSHWWGGVNSASILEPIVELYKLTGEERYLTFAKYILESGGCRDGNLLLLAEEGKLAPYEYPTVKAYEMMSYFEGALAYYEVTGETRYLNIVEKFAEAVCDTDITIMKIASVDGGGLRNAIPREAVAVVLVKAADVAEVKSIAKQYEAVFVAEYAGIEDSIAVSVVDAAVAPVMPADVANRLMAAVVACPDGVEKMSMAMEGLVQTSNNLARVVSDGKSVKLQTLMRSSVRSEKEALGDAIKAVFELAGAEVELSGSYDGWNPNMESPILKAMLASYEALYGKRPAVTAIHAGLECGIIGSNYPNLDMISFGPTICYPHSPDEKVNIASVGKFYDFLLHTLKNAPKK